MSSESDARAGTQPGHLIAFISDAHPDIGDDQLAQARLDLLDSLKANQSVRLIVYSGDCFGDLQCSTARRLLLEPKLRKWYEKVREIADDPEAPRQFVVLGNHDRDITRKRGAALRALLPDNNERFPVVLHGAPGTQIDPDLAGWFVTHGDEFDWTTPMWVSLLFAGRALLGEEGMATVAQWIIGRYFFFTTPGRKRQLMLRPGKQKRINRDTDRYEKTIPGIHRKAWIRAQDRQELILFGHTHYEFSGCKPLGRMATLNPGALDAVDAMTYGLFDTRSREFSLMKFDSTAHTSKAALTQTLWPVSCRRGFRGPRPDSPPAI